MSGRCRTQGQRRLRQGARGHASLLEEFGERPELEGLNPPMVAEVLLHVGILTRWIGSKNQISDAQDVAKDLISESITLFESLGDTLRVAAARAELGFAIG